MQKTRILVLFLGLLLSSMILPASAQEPAISARPDGTGDPDATTCRIAQPIPNSRFIGPRVCKLNSQWALLRKNGEDISADGKDIISDPKSGASMNCTMIGGGATSGGQMNCRAQ